MPRRKPFALPKLPELPKLPSTRTGRSLKVVVPSVPNQPSEAQTTEARWHVWQTKHPDKGTASILEFLVYEFLVDVKKQVEGVDFIYQYPLMGGRTQFGGFVADFYFPARREVWNPAGLHFHWTTAVNRARDIVAKQVLAGRGIKLIYLWEDDLLNRPQYTMNKAWNGIQLIGREI